MSTIVEKISLNFTDLLGDKTGCVKKGSNKFWTGEVEDLGGGMANFKCRWGPTGSSGSDKGSKHNISMDLAIKTLNSKAKSKEKKGYTRLDTRSIQEETAKAAAKGVDLTGSKAKKVTPKVAAPTRTFHREVERLLGVVYQATSSVVRSGLSAQAGATEDNPIGNLSDHQLDLGGDILDEIGQLLTAKGVKGSTALPLVRGVPSRDIIELTNRFMSNVPRALSSAHRGRQNLHHIVVSSQDRLEEQRKFLQLLRDAHLAQATFKAAAAAGPNLKAAVWYDGLGCNIEFCEPGSADFNKVNDIFQKGQSRKNANWFRGGRSTLQVTAIFKFTRNNTEGSFDRYAEKVTSKKGATGRIMAWHGTRDANVLGIGKSGLLMPENLPKGVMLSGKAFGRGIYHAPVFTDVRKVEGYTTDGTNGALKSMNYTSARGAYYGSGNSGNEAFMFLQEVALGRGEVYTRPCWDKKRPTGFPQKDFIYANAGGCSTLSHDELVTFSEDAQIFRYLLRVKAS